jgi:hypothetical protein
MDKGSAQPDRRAAGRTPEDIEAMSVLQAHV